MRINGTNQLKNKQKLIDKTDCLRILENKQPSATETVEKKPL